VRKNIKFFLIFLIPNEFLKIINMREFPVYPSFSGGFFRFLKPKANFHKELPTMFRREIVSQIMRGVKEI